MAELRVTEQEMRDLVVTRLNLLDAPAFDGVRATARRLRVPLERAIVDRARVPLAFLLAQLAQVWQVGFSDLKTSDVSAKALGAIKEEYARTNAVVAFDLTDSRLSVAMWDPRDRRVLSELQRMTGRQVVPVLAPLASIRRAHLLYRGDLRAWLAQAAGDAAVPAQAGADEAASQLLTRILEFGVVSSASDIHIEPYELEGLVRCRIDGVLQEVLGVPVSSLPSLVARIKVVAGMRIDERRAPQDGRFETEVAGLKQELRVSTLPTHWGEKVVMRVLSKDTEIYDLEDLGLTSADYPLVLEHLMRPFGMVLITGPTGSGKTTTLYAMMGRLAVERRNVVNITTIEDPVEYPLPRISQVAVNVAAGIDFASGLRALLRQDPDVIMVGEIRDRETADIAVRSALVGRLLFSTLHTNDATSAVARLLDMGVEPFLLASTLSMVVAQRLARRICMACRESIASDAALVHKLRSTPGVEEAIPILQAQGILSSSNDPLAHIRLFRGRGCAQCNGTGFRSRIGIFELFEVRDHVRSLIMERREASAVRTAAIEGGMKTMFQDGLAKVFLGETTIEEVTRVSV